MTVVETELSVSAEVEGGGTSIAFIREFTTTYAQVPEPGSPPPPGSTMAR